MLTTVQDLRIFTTRGVARAGPKGSVYLEFEHFTTHEDHPQTPRAKEKTSNFGHFKRTAPEPREVPESPLPLPSYAPTVRHDPEEEERAVKMKLR